MDRKTLATLLAAALALAARAQDGPLTRENGTDVVATDALCKAKGYTGPAPVRIYIKDGKIERVRPMRNMETPKYMALVRQQMLPRWEGMSVARAAKAKVDGVTGATVTSKAILKNVQAGCQYYLKNR